MNFDPLGLVAGLGIVVSSAMASGTTYQVPKGTSIVYTTVVRARYLNGAWQRLTQ